MYLINTKMKQERRQKNDFIVNELMNQIGHWCVCVGGGGGVIGGTFHSGYVL